MKKCPQCGSRNARPSQRRELERWIAALQIRPFRCQRCHRRFWWIDPPSLRSTGLGPLAPVILVLAAGVVVALYMAGLPYAEEAAAGARAAAGVDDSAAVPTTGPASAAAGDLTPPASTGRRFVGVEPIEITDDRLRLMIATGGPPTAWSRFYLARPPRLAIDLEGRWDLLRRRSPVFLNHPLVQQVRADRYDGAVRIEIELGPAPGTAPTVEETADGLIVTFRRSGD